MILTEELENKMFTRDISQKLQEKFCDIRDLVRMDLELGKNLEDSIEENLSKLDGISPEVYQKITNCLIETDYDELRPCYDKVTSSPINSYAQSSDSLLLSDDF